MIDVGNPFSRPYTELIASIEDNLREGVEQPEVEEFVFQSSQTAYGLRRSAHAVQRVTGLSAGTTFTVFQSGIDYRLSNNRILWIAGAAAPVEGKRFQVEYTYRDQPAGLTDFNPGSVLGTLVRAFARELKFLFEQMDQSYRRAFIDHASGVALDNVVALLGIERGVSLPSKGFVTFFRKKAASQTYVIPAGTRVANEGGRLFVTLEAGAIPSSAPSEGEVVAADGVSLTLVNRIATLQGVWPLAQNPAVDPPLGTQPVTAEQPFGATEREVKLSAPFSGQLRVRYLPKSVSVAVEAVEPGPQGDVNARSITVMPTPPTGIDGVTNDLPITGGTLPEPDEQLRERTKHHLERLGNATLNALQFATLEVEGVEGVSVEDHSTDATIPLGEVRISTSGGELEDIREVVERTRAAGIRAVISQISEVFIGGTFYVLPASSVPATATASFLAAVIEELKALAIGEALTLGKLKARVYGIDGLADVAEAVLEKTSDHSAIADPFIVKKTEHVRPDEAALGVVLLTGLRVDAVRRVGLSHEIDVQLQSESGPVTFVGYRLVLTASVQAKLRTAPEQPPRFVGMVAALLQLDFSGGNLATITIDDSAVTGFDPATHADEVQLILRAAAYPGLPSATALIHLPIS